MNDADFKQFLAKGKTGVETVNLCGSKSAYLNAVANGRVWSQTIRLLEKTAPSVVAVAGWAFSESLAAIAWAREQRVPVVMMSASQQRDGKRSGHREYIKSRIVKMCDSALVGGRQQGEYLQALGMPANKIFHGYDAVDNDHFHVGSDHARINCSQLQDSIGLPERYLLAAGRFIAKKNLPRLIEAFRGALDASQTAHHLVILGDGPERHLVEEKIQNCGLKTRVHLFGFQNYQRLPHFYGLAEAFVHVSLTEQWGLVINEAASSGLPLIVSSSCGAADELVEDESNGILVKATSVSSIMHAMTKIMLATPQELSSMGIRSREIVSNWGPERFAEGLKSAADAGLATGTNRRYVWDTLLLRALSRRSISAVT
jgi:glycosyltransferase involved in cell wall biosynthesis